MAVLLDTRASGDTLRFVSKIHDFEHQQQLLKEQQRPRVTQADFVSQFAFLGGYSHVIYGFRTPDDKSQQEIIEALKHALRTIVEGIPWLGGQVSQINGVYQPSLWPKDTPKNELLRVKECHDLLPSMDEMLAADVPVSMLPGDILTPWPSLPAAHGLKPPFPALAIQANFIRGGLLLDMIPHHIAMDGTGLTQVLSLLATVLSGRQISLSDIQQAHRDRSELVPLIPANEPVKDCSHLRRPPGWTPTPPVSPPQWCNFKLPLLSLPELRKQAKGPGGTTFSDNDIICAFCWQRLSIGRLRRGVSPDTIVKFTRAVDGRGVLGVPPSYIGHMIHHSIVGLPLGEVASSPLFRIAQALREDLTATNTAWAIRSYATFISREEDNTQLVFGGLRNVNLDLGGNAHQSVKGIERVSEPFPAPRFQRQSLTSILHFLATSVSTASGDDAVTAAPEHFGPLGPVLFIRRPNVTPIPGTITITQAENGALPITLCLPEVDLEVLKTDGEWKRFIKFVG